MGNNDYISQEPMLEMFVFETLQMIEQLEELLIDVEKTNSLSSDSVNEIFRIMHTIKGSSAMMMYNGIATLAHSIEDLFAQIRDKKVFNLDCAQLTDIVLHSADFFKGEIAKIQDGKSPDGAADGIIDKIHEFMHQSFENSKDVVSTKLLEKKIESSKYYISNYKGPDIKETKKYFARITFQDGCMMENIRAYTVIHSLKDLSLEVYSTPKNVIEDENSSEKIRADGFELYFSSAESQEKLYEVISQTLFLDKLDFSEIVDFPEEVKTEFETATINLEAKVNGNRDGVENERESKLSVLKQQNIISVNLTKLDVLMDLVGEIVISEAMVTRNPDLDGLVLDNFNKAARQLRKLTSELQDIVMSIRMIQVAATFNKMHRIVRDMNHKLDKDVELVLLGQETEVDKNIIDHLSDPLMHLIRNALDHGIEGNEERLHAGKPQKGTIVLEAKNAGGDVWITVKDDGKGLNKDKILVKAKEKGLLTRPEIEYTEKEIYSFILLPGFSTKEKVSEFSGRGVGMDVVKQNIEKIGGSIIIDSILGRGTTISIKIPLTLAIIDGMIVAVGKSRYIIPTTAIRESFRAEQVQIVEDAEGNELIMLRGECYSVLRIHRKFNVDTSVTNLTEGIIVVVETGCQTICLFADELQGEQEVVVKPIPSYIKKSKGLAGCTILGDGSISLIIDVGGIFES